MGTPGGGVAHRGRLLERNADAAARGVSEDLFGLFVEAVAPQAVTGRVAGGLRWAREHARPSRPTGGRGRGPCGAQWRAASRGCGNGEGSVRVRLRVWESYAGQSKECVLGKERVRFLTRKGQRCSLLCQWVLTGKQTLGGGGGALQRGHGAPLEPLAQLGDALRGVGALSTIVQATDLVFGQAASMGGSESVSAR